VAAPTFVSWTEVTNYHATGTPKAVSVAVQTGDLIIVAGATEDNAFTMGTPSDTVNTYTSRQNAGTTSFCKAQIWSATAASSATLSISNTCSNSGKEWGFGVAVYRSHGGLGTSTSTTQASPAAPSLAITTTAASSALLFVVGDWNAVDGTVRTYRQVNSASPTERHYSRNSATYTTYAASYADAGTAASKTVGLTTPSTMKVSIAVIEVKASAGTTVTGTATCLITEAATIIGTPKVLGTTARDFGGSFVAVATPKVLGTAQLTETATAVAVATPKVYGQALAAIDSTRLVAGTRQVSGTATLAVTSSNTAVGTPKVYGALLRAEAFSAAAYVSSPLYRTAHKVLGHAPASNADYVSAFSPNTASGGWHRGDGAQSILGATWQLFVFNDFFISNGSGGVTGAIVNNSILEVGDDGNVWWLSGGNGGASGSRTFPDMTGGRTLWLKGGWATSSTSAIILAGSYISGTIVRHEVMKIDGIGTTTPSHGSISPAGIETTSGITWGSQPYVHAGYVYLHGINFNTFAAHVTRCAFSAGAGAYEAPWEVWTGSAWVAGGTPGAVTIGTGPLAQLSVTPQNPDYGTLLGSSKVFNTAPGLGVSDVTYTEIRGWTASAPQGPWTYLGVFYQPTTRTGWYSYAGRIDQLKGVDRMTAVWSQNTDVGFDPDIYGPQIADARNQLSGDAAAAPVFATTATGAPRSMGVATVAATFGASASGRAESLGTGATSVTFTSPASGTTSKLGQASAALAFGASALGSTAGSVAGSGATSLVFNVATVGTVQAFGVTLVTLTSAATALGQPTVTGLASVASSWAATASGLPTVGGSLSAALSFTGTASGTGTALGGGQGQAALSFSAAGTGRTVVTGSGALVATVFTGAASGVIPRTGTGATSVTFGATASGTSARAGAGSGSWTFTASSIGTPTARGTSTAAFVLGASASARRYVTGTATRALVFASSGSGSAYVPAEGLGGRVIGTPSYEGDLSGGATGALVGSVASASRPGGITSGSDSAQVGGIS
jgi:hypothetical protein